MAFTTDCNGTSFDPDKSNIQRGEHVTITNTSNEQVTVQFESGLFTDGSSVVLSKAGATGDSVTRQVSSSAEIDKTYWIGEPPNHTTPLGDEVPETMTGELTVTN